MTTYRVTEQQFLKEVAEHRMSVQHQVGLYRHLRFRKEDGTSFYWFDITTWPGFLCFSGDMGAYVFSRVTDMFEFFRSSKSDELYINPGYWAEKCEAQDRRSGITEYSADRFREAIANRLDDQEASLELRRWVEEDVLRSADEGEHVARVAVNDFQYKNVDDPDHDGFQFADFWETNLHVYTQGFIWCCYALAWAVRQYDAQATSDLTITHSLR